MKIDENTIIKCNNVEEVKDCLDKLKELGFETCYSTNAKELIVAKSANFCYFSNKIWTLFDIKNYCVNYKTFVKLYNKQIKEKEPDLVVDKNGKVLKINYYDPKLFVYSYDTSAPEMTGIPLGWFIAKNISINEIDCYISKEACEKAKKRNIIRRKLEALAFELNGNRDITEEEWNNHFIEKYYLYYIMSDNSINSTFNLESKNQGTIFCLSRYFKDRAIELIGEEDLKDYLMNC